MTIVGIDTGLATCGWAVLDERTCTLVDLGVVLTEKSPGEKVTLDRVERAFIQASVLTEVVRDASVVVVEAMSFPPGGANAMVSIALSWGLALGIVASAPMRPTLLAVSPQRWQREIDPSAGKRVDYEKLSAKLQEHMRQRHPRAYASLEGIAGRHRNHAIDAAALALVGHLAPGRCMTVRAPRPRRTKSLAMVADEAQALFIPRPGVPASRDDCRHGERPCPYVRCKHHLWRLDPQPRSGRLRPGQTERPMTPTTLMPRWLEYPTPPCCELDITEAMQGRRLTYGQIGYALGTQDDQPPRIARSGLAKIRAELERTGIEREADPSEADS